MELRSTIPLPARLLDLQERMQVATFMGLLPELHHAWLSVDNKLLLWDYVDGADYVKEVSCCVVQCFRGMSAHEN